MILDKYSRIDEYFKKLVLCELSEDFGTHSIVESLSWKCFNAYERFESYVYVGVLFILLFKWNENITLPIGIYSYVI